MLLYPYRIKGGINMNMPNKPEPKSKCKTVGVSDKEKLTAHILTGLLVGLGICFVIVVTNIVFN